MTELLVDVLLPGAAIVISACIAIGLAILERRAARHARLEERRDRVLEDLMESLSFFVSANPLAEEMAPPTRRLRSRVMLLQTLPGETTRLVGQWLALEIEVGLPLFSKAMQSVGSSEHVSIDEMLAALKPAHRAFHECLVRLTVWMRGEVEDEAILDRTELLVRGGVRPYVEEGDELTTG